jgi:hypothetical protein
VSDQGCGKRIEEGCGCKGASSVCSGKLRCHGVQLPWQSTMPELLAQGNLFPCMLFVSCESSPLHLFCSLDWAMHIKSLGSSCLMSFLGTPSTCPSVHKFVLWPFDLWQSGKRSCQLPELARHSRPGISLNLHARISTYLYAV